MVAIMRKRRAMGRAIRIQYKGHDVEPERLERASKRFKGPLDSPVSKLHFCLCIYLPNNLLKQFVHRISAQVNLPIEAHQYLTILNILLFMVAVLRIYLTWEY